MTQRQKIAWVEKLFGLIQKMFGENNLSMTIHSIDMTQLPKGWRVSTNKKSSGDGDYTTAERKSGGFDITLFD